MQSLLQVDFLLLIITIGRLSSIVIGVVGLISVILGRQALTRSSRSLGSGRPRAIAALVMGLTGVILSVLHLILSTGGFGTGSGKLGAIIAMIVGLTGVILGALALARLQRIARSSNITAASARK